MSDDDAAYNKSVRNMIIVLAVIVITVFAFIFIPPVLNPPRDIFQNSVSTPSSQGFTLSLTVNATQMGPGDSLSITALATNTQGTADNISSAAMWGVDKDRLWTAICLPGFPIGVGVMEGHFDEDNYTLGRLLTPWQHGLASCPIGQLESPTYFDFIPHSSRALVSIGGNPSFWTIESDVQFNANSTLELGLHFSSQFLQSGVYTAVAADEWGDVITTNFRVS